MWVVAGMAAPCLAHLRAGQSNLADTCSDETQDMAPRWREGIVHHLICPERCGLIPVISFQSLAGPRGRRIGGWADVAKIQSGGVMRLPASFTTGTARWER